MHSASCNQIQLYPPELCSRLKKMYSYAESGRKSAVFLKLAIVLINYTFLCTIMEQ